MATSIEEMANWNRYPTLSVYNQMMAKFVADYPNLCKLDTIGTSVQNRNMLVLNITADIHTPKPKPEVLFSSTMHGDETTGWILCLRLCDYLLSKYGTDPRITNMLDSISIFIAPNTNPDGTYHGSSGSTTISGAVRYNANNVDLNRNYPDPRAGQHPDGYAWQKETIAMMNLAEAKHFILSINYHGGEEVANYPWDTWTSAQRKHADNDWYIQICTQYVALAKATAPSSYFGSWEFNYTGITNGGDWYVITGGRQDYMNYWKNCREITLEVSSTKMVGSETLPNYWNYNRDAMLTYIENVKYGIRGIVSGSDGVPVDAKITVVGYDKDNSQVVTNSQFGNYYRMLKAGTYTLLFDAYGYESQTITGVVVQQNQATILNITLQKKQTYTINGIVVNATTGAPVENVAIEVKDTPIKPFTTNSNGNFSLDIQSGTYTFVFSKDDFVKKEQTIEIGENTDFLVISLEPFDGFDFEDGQIPPEFTFSGNQNWYIVSNEAYHGLKSIRSGNITHNQSSTMIYTFTAANAGKVIFYSKVSSEKGYDELKFYINGVNKGTWSGNMDWEEHAYDIPAGEHILKWTYAKDYGVSVGSDCAWVDYISVPKNVQNAVPYIDPKNIAFETQEIVGDTLLTLQNIGNANLNFNATIENEQDNSWLSLSNNSGVLSPNQKNEIVLSFDFTSLPNGEYITNVLIDVVDSILYVPVSILFFGNIEEEFGIPYISVENIDIEIEEAIGDYEFLMQNIGNKAFDYYLSIEPEESAKWLSLSHNSGILDAKEQVDIVLSYDFSDFIITKHIFSATLNIDVVDSIIQIPVNINFILNIFTPETFTFYPNPTTGELKIKKMDGEYEIFDMIYEIYDLFGRKMDISRFARNDVIPNETQQNEKFLTIDISHLPAGIYLAKINTNAGEFVRKIVKL
jgi:hypothetical protein